MEQKPEKEAQVKFLSRWIKWILAGISAFCLLVFIVYTLLSVTASNRLIEVYNTKLQQVEIQPGPSYSDLTDESVPELLGKKAFLESQLGLLNSDSVNMVIDLRDSIVALVLEGVTLHTAAIRYYGYSRFFSVLSADAYLKVFSKPFQVEKYTATIVKEPITVKEAPKDTLEAAYFFEMPDTVINEYVVVKALINQGFALTFRQEEPPHAGNTRNSRNFFLFQRMQKLGTDLNRLIHFRLPVYEPEIEISLPKDELVTMFRAIPASAKIAIRIR